jgi:hypothetical protein
LESAVLPAGNRYLRQAEIQDLGVSSFAHEDVRRFDVAMDDVFDMGCHERICNFAGDFQQPVQFHRMPADEVSQHRPVQILHDDESFATLLTNVINRADVWMIER